MITHPDGTQPWPHDLTPIDRVALAVAEVIRARHEVDVAMHKLSQAVAHLVQAARGGHE